MQTMKQLFQKESVIKILLLAGLVLFVYLYLQKKTPLSVDGDEFCC
ncbi:hypothetical protein [Clostridium estertheticum]|uniref:Uncharacterized protein n=1 Tax=Clostridium estertheticum TaxID=238834 RepID=A0AA47EHA6_9CLOT|nr:hypothetical protein [Clostridium estertheticum]MBU3157822.1 hypothetical protein [Clostridium estertheticum]WAG59404.1 hypothetical protein LL038_17420 [Clostridium estertheticum]